MLTLNFSIIGAQKSGTTALFAYLGQHPDLFMCPTKELGFFAYEGARPDFKGPGDKRYTRGMVCNWNDYCRAFRGARPDQLVGEASVIYQYNFRALQNLQSRFPEIKLLSILRDPIERAYSAYSHLVRDEREKETFARGIELEGRRIEDNYEPLWHYRRVGLYGEQLSRVFKLFPKQQVKVLLAEDLDRDTVRTVQDCFEFLGVDNSFEPDVSFRPNRSGTSGNRTLSRFINKPNPMKEGLKRVIPLKLRWKVKSLLQPGSSGGTTVISDELKRSLQVCFREDVKLLENLLERDLGHWLEGAP